MKKNLSYLIESELEKAEVVLAAKAITDSIQKMAEQVAKMEASDVMPLLDPIREYFGPEASTSFSAAVTEKLRALTQTLSDTRNAVSDEIARMSGEMDGVPQNDLANMDDDGLGDGNSAPADSDVAQDDAAPAADAAPTDGGGDMAPVLGGDDAGAPAADAPADGGAPAEAPAFSNEDMGSLKAAGRARKESVEATKPMLETASPDRIVAQEYVSYLREGKTPSEAATLINESYGLGVDALIDIVSAYRKK